MRRLKIGFLTSDDARSRTMWSGSPFYMAQALRRHCGEVVYLGPAYSPVELTGKVLNKLSQKILGRRRAYHHTFRLSRQYARIFRKRLRSDLDVIFAPGGATQVALLQTDLPIVYTSDATFERMHDYYPAFSGLTEEYAADANEIERLTLERCSAVLYPSEWAAESARSFYGADPSKIHVVPYGANLDTVPPRELLAHSKREDVCRVLFLGVDWERKGGPIAYEAVAALRGMGMKAELTVCGCVPPAKYRAEWVRVIRRLNKNDPAQQAELSNLLLTASFLLVPTRHECYGLVFCEASAHGTPSLATDTGGVGGAVQHGRNGFLLPPSAPPGEYARLMRECFLDRERYLRMVASSRDAYDESLNWDAWAARACRVLADACASR